jgi:hypothetical protein
MAWCLIKHGISIQRGGQLSMGYVFMVWCLIKRGMSSWRGA